MVRRGVSSRLSDNHFFNLVSKPGWALITILTFSGSLSDVGCGSFFQGSYSVLSHALYLKCSAVDLASAPVEEILSGNIDGLASEAMFERMNAMVKEIPHECYGFDSSEHVEVLSGKIDGLAPEAMAERFWSDEAEWFIFHPSAPEAMVKVDKI
jgi:hypothetical protein